MSEYHQYKQKPMNQKTNMLNLFIDVFVLDGQQLDTKDVNFIKKTRHLVNQYSFYAPNEIAENITHSWEEHDSIAGKAGQIATAGAQDVKEIGYIFKGQTSGDGKFKLDSPLVWKNSARREYSFPITLLDQEEPNKIAGVVQDFKRMSSAKTQGALSSIGYPYIFRIRLVPGALLMIESAALTGIQSTYHHPYIGGYPTKIDLTLTFVDLQPVFEHSFDGELATKITTNNPRNRR